MKIIDGIDRLKSRVLLASAAATLILGAATLKVVFDSIDRIKIAIEKDLSGYGQTTLVSMIEAFNLVDFTLKRARQEWIQTGKLRPHEEFTNDFPNFKELIVQVAVIGPDGYLLASSLQATSANVYLGEREHFLVHAKSEQDFAYVSKQIVGKVSGKRTIQFTRPIVSAGQKFQGVIVASINPEYFLKRTVIPVSDAGLVAVLKGSDGSVRLHSENYTEDASDDKEAGDSSDHHDEYTGRYIWSRSVIDPLSLELKIGYPVHKMREQINTLIQMGFLAFSIIVLLIFWYSRSIVRLIDGRNKLLIKLENSNLKANSASSMKSKFVAGISHELRTPLNSILGFSELVKMSRSHDEAREYGAIIFNGASHLHHLVNTLLDLAKIEAGQMTVVRTWVDLDDLLQSVVSLHRYEAEKKCIAVSANVQATSPRHIYADRIKLMQVLSNLLHNSVKFTEQGAIFINAGVVNRSWEISVIDTGIGMSNEQLAGVFERFNNIKNDCPESSGIQGAGLGMALCKEMIELMDGTIEVQSGLGDGTSVTIRLGYICNEDRS